MDNVCPITGMPMEPVFSNRILNRHTITYYYSKVSGLLKTEKPYWLDEAYSSAIASTDSGLVSRNLRNVRMLQFVLGLLRLGRGTFVDIAGGYGLLARLLRDRGYDCYTFDKYCTNLFAQGFEPAEGLRADCLFAFEVLEHVEDPLAFLSSEMDRYQCKNIVFSTLTFSGTVPAPDWWYYAFDTGQHITFYQSRTLELIAKKLGVHYYMINPGMHLFTQQGLPVFKRVLLTNKYARKLLCIAGGMIASAGESRGC